MAYMCILGHGECDGCMECYPKPTCKHCGKVLTDDEYSEYDDECEECHAYWFEEEENEEDEEDEED